MGTEEASPASSSDSRENPRDDASANETQTSGGIVEHTPDVPSEGSTPPPSSDTVDTTTQVPAPRPVDTTETIAVGDQSDVPPTDSAAEPVVSESVPVEDPTADPTEKCSTSDAPVSEVSREAKVPARKPVQKANLTVGQKKKPESKQTLKQLAAQHRKEAKQKKRQRKIDSFKDYFDHKEKLAEVPPHRFLAISRGERSKILRVKIEADVEAMQSKADELLVPAGHPHADFLRGCVRDSLSRLVIPSLDREIRREMTERAELQAVKVFIRNLRKLLLQPPVHALRVLAIDPGFRSGCKVAALDEFGNVLGHTLIHVIGKEDVVRKGREQIVEMVRMYHIPAIAIGNGTACREAESLVANVIANELSDSDVKYVIVNEAGASVYSTSPLGREELGSFDPLLRSAISIGRRLLDPLSELVKINPANIGVGMYQHDMKAKHLQDSLDGVVESCVNFVGVDVNTASPSLLRYVSGLNQLTARRVYDYRKQNGPFRNREQLKDVPGFGEATFVQSAGFLKIPGAEEPLDATWIHPESYDIARRVIEKLGGSLDELAATTKQTDGERKPEFAENLHADAVKSQSEQPTAEQSPTEQPPTEQTQAATDEHQAAAADDTKSVADDDSAEQAPDKAVSPPATASDDAPSVTQLATTGSDREQALPEAPPAAKEASSPTLSERIAAADVSALAEELGVGEHLLRDILSSLMRPGRDPREDLSPPMFRREVMKLEDLEAGMELTGTVLNVVDFGAFVDIGLHDSGLIHISRLADRFVNDPHDVVSVGDILTVWVVEVDKQRRRVSLTAIEPGTEKPQQERGERKRRGGHGERRSRKPREGKKQGGRSGKRQQAERTRPQRKPQPPKPVKPITEAMVDGKEPMRSFSDLIQFYDRKPDGDNKKKKSK